MKRHSITVLFILFSVLVGAQAALYLPRSTPAAQGVDTQAVIDMMDSLLALPECEIHHVMVVRHGNVIAELHPAPYRQVDTHTLYSASKTYASLAVGVAIDEGLLHLDDKVISFFPDKLPTAVGDNLAAMTVRDLLMMASGVAPDWALRNNSDDWVRDWLALPVADEPGSRFQYDSMCTFMLSAIVQRVTGRTLLEYLSEKVLRPMDVVVADWETSPDGINTGGWGLRVQAETMAKLGLLLLNKGNWHGQQLVSADYVTAACSRLIDGGARDTVPPTDGNQGYGYQVWQSKWPGSYRADGAFGQYVVVVPQEELVVVIMGMKLYGHEELACIWNQLMPGMRPKPLRKQSKLQHRLERLCSQATLPLPQGQRNSHDVNLMGMTLKLGPNQHGFKWLRCDAMGLFTVALDDDSSESFYIDYGKWCYKVVEGLPPYSIKARNRMQGLTQDFVAASAFAWTSPTTMEIRIHYVNWISGLKFVIDTVKNEVTISDTYPNTKPEVVPFTALKI